MSRKVLIPIDGSANSERAFKYYMEEIKKDGDHLFLLHVQDVPHLPSFSIHEPMSLPTEEWGRVITENVKKTTKLMENYEAQCEQVKLPKTPVVVTGKPGEMIVELAKSKMADIIVMGSRGLNGVRRTFLGSVSDYVIHHTHLPALVVPPVAE